MTEKMTDDQIKEAARVLCVIRGQDPDALYGHEPQRPNSHFAEHEIRHAEQIRAAIEGGKLVTATKKARQAQG